MITKTIVHRVLFVLLTVFWLGGCVQTKTTPGYARAGDHIVIGLGGVIRNAGGEASIKASDLVVTLTDSSSQQFVLESRFIFKSYLDYTAQMNTFSLDGTNTNVGLVGMVPYDGGWFVVSPLTYPTEYGSPLPLAVGAATISVSSPTNKLLNTANNVEGDLTTIPIEIIEGTSPQDVDFVRQFIGYVKTPNSFVIIPDSLAGIDEVGGAYFEINYNDDQFFQGGLEPIVVPSDHNPYVQLNYNVVSNGDGTGTIIVTLLNPAGFRTVATADPNSSFLSDLTVRLNYFPVGGLPPTPTQVAQAKANFSVDTFNSYYIGMNGAVIPGVTPVLTHAVDL